MKYTITFRCPEDPLFAPWPMVVESTRHPDVLTVQSPHPCEGDNLIGFESTFERLDVTTHEEGWPEKSIGLGPVFAGGGGMYSLQGYEVESVIDDEALVTGSVKQPCTS